MNALDKEIEELKKKHASLEIEKYNASLIKKYDELKKLEGTVEVRVYKASKTSRHITIVHHILYEMLKDSWKRESEKEHNYIGVHIRTIKIFEAPRSPYTQYEINCRETKPSGYDGKLHYKEEGYSHDYSTHKTISVEEFNSIWNSCKSVVANIIDGNIGIKEVPWIMTGSDADFEFKSTGKSEYQKYALDIPSVLLTQEESYKLNNKYTRIFMHKNIYLITPNSLLALDEWLDDERRMNNLYYSSCASVGERWQGSRIDEYVAIVNKIKYNKLMQ